MGSKNTHVLPEPNTNQVQSKLLIVYLPVLAMQTASRPDSTIGNALR